MEKENRLAENVLVKLGFKKIDDGFVKGKCTVYINEHGYEVRFEGEGTMYSTDRSIYWLEGVLFHYGIVHTNVEHLDDIQKYRPYRVKRIFMFYYGVFYDDDLLLAHGGFSNMSNVCDLMNSAFHAGFTESYVRVKYGND